MQDLGGADKRDRDEMKNATECLKNCKVVRVSEGLSPNYLAKETGKKVDDRNAWGRDDFGAIIRRNMEEYKEDKNE